MARAVWFVGPRTAELRDDDVADPKAGEIQVAGICSLVSAGTEMNLYRGEANPGGLERFPTSRGQLPFPVKFGYHEVGEVVAAGDDSGFAVGDRALCFHPHQELFTIDASLAWKLPPDLLPERAAFMALFFVAVNSMLTTPVLVGDCVAVSGLGVVGSLTAALARRNASRLILVDPAEKRRKAAEWIGADAVVDPSEASTAIAELTDGRDVDLFFEASGAPAALQTALDNTAMEGTVSVSAWYGTRQVPLSLSPEFHFRRHQIVSTGPTLPPALAPRWDLDRVWTVIWDYLADLKVDELLITHRVPFSRAPEAFELVDSPDRDSLAVLIEHERPPQGA